MNWWLILFITLVFLNGFVGFFLGWKAGIEYQERIDKENEVRLIHKKYDLELKDKEKENKDE